MYNNAIFICKWHQWLIFDPQKLKMQFSISFSSFYFLQSYTTWRHTKWWDSKKGRDLQNTYHESEKDFYYFMKLNKEWIKKYSMTCNRHQAIFKQQKYKLAIPAFAAPKVPRIRLIQSLRRKWRPMGTMSVKHPAFWFSIHKQQWRAAFPAN